MKRAALYARFSSDEQDVRSIKDQIALAREYAQERGYIILAEFGDEAVWGGTPMRLRPEGRMMMERADAREFDVMVTEAADRLARSQGVMASVFEELRFVDVEIETLKDRRALTPMDICFEGYKSAEYGRDLAQKVRRGHISRVREGRVPGSRRIYGYSFVKGEPGERTVNEPEAAVVRRIYQDTLAGLSEIAIAQALNAEDIPAPGGGPWTRGAIGGSRSRRNGIVNQELYIGRIYYGRRSQSRSPKTAKRVGRANPEAKWTRGIRPDLAIIDVKTWEAVQELRARGAHPLAPRKRQPKHLLAGLLICGLCGSTMHLTGVRKTRYYVCSARIKRRGCKNTRMVPAPEAERRVLEGLQRSFRSREAVELAVTTYRKERERLRAERTRTRNVTERELGEVKRKVAATVEAIHEAKKRGLDIPALVNCLADLEAQRKRLEAKLPSAEVDVVELHPQAARRYGQIVDDLGKALAGPEPARTRATVLLRSLITHIVVIPTAPRMPVGLEVTGDLLALIDEKGELRRNAASQAAPLAITV